MQIKTIGIWLTTMKYPQLDSKEIFNGNLMVSDFFKVLKETMKQGTGTTYCLITYM